MKKNIRIMTISIIRSALILVIQIGLVLDTVRNNTCQFFLVYILKITCVFKIVVDLTRINC